MKRTHVIALATLAAMAVAPAVAAYEQDNHRELTHFALDLLTSDHDLGRETELYRSSIEQGSWDEDEGSRALHHFYDPTTRLGLPSNSYERWFYKTFSASKPPIPPTYDGVRYRSARDWGRDGMPDGWDWKSAIEKYGDVALGSQGRRDAWKAVGHILHLVQDMAQPDHAVDRPHPGNDPLVSGTLDWIPVRSHKLGYEALWQERFNEEDPKGTPDWPRATTVQEVESLEEAFDKVALASQAAMADAKLPRVKDETALGLGNFHGDAYTESTLVSGLLLNGLVNEQPVKQVEADAARMRDSLWRTYEIDVPLLPTIPTHPGDERTDAYLALGRKMLPLAESWSAGVVRLFFRIVNPPPIVESVVITQDGEREAGYRAEWKLESASRRLEKTGPGSLVAGQVAHIRIEFGQTLDLEKTKFTESVDGVRVAIEEGSGESKTTRPVEQDELTGNVWTGHVTPSAAGRLVIEARDTDPHLKNRNFAGDLLDSDPSTIARASGKVPYDWSGYEPGADRNHTFTIVGGCPRAIAGTEPGTVSRALREKARWAELKGTLTARYSAADGERDPNAHPPEWLWAGDWSSTTTFQARVHTGQQVHRTAVIGRLLGSAATTQSSGDAEQLPPNPFRAIEGEIVLEGSYAGTYRISPAWDHVDGSFDEFKKTGHNRSSGAHMGDIAGDACSDGTLRGSGHSERGSKEWVDKKIGSVIALKGNDSRTIQVKQFESASWDWNVRIEPVAPPAFVAGCEIEHHAQSRVDALLKLRAVLAQDTRTALRAFVVAHDKASVLELSKLCVFPSRDSTLEAELRDHEDQIDRSCEDLGTLWVSSARDADTRLDAGAKKLSESVKGFRTSDQALTDLVANQFEAVGKFIEKQDPVSAKELRRVAARIRDGGVSVPLN